MPERPSSLAEVMRAAIAARLADVHTAIPARVTKYDPAQQKASVQPVVKSAYVAEDESRQVESLPVVNDVPVHFPGGGGYRITFPIKEGDTGLLIFSEASIDVWLAKGGDVDPGDDNRFQLAAGVFVPGVRDFAHALKSAAGDRMTLGKDDGLQIHIDGAKIKIGSNLDVELDNVALASAIMQWATNLQVALATHTHPTAAPGPPSMSTTVFPTPSNIASQSVFAKKT